MCVLAGTIIRLCMKAWIGDDGSVVMGGRRMAYKDARMGGGYRLSLAQFKGNKKH